MRTSRSRRWIWIRIPSSFHSTEDSSKPDIASATLGAGRGEHREDRPEDLEPDRAQSPPRPRSSRSRPSASDRPTASAPGARSRRGTPAALATASAITPASAPCRSSPVNSRRRNAASASVARPSRSASRSPARPRRSGPGGVLDLVDRPIDVDHGQRGARPRAGLDRVDRRVAHPDAALTGNARQEPDADRDLIRLELPQQLGENRDLARARARLADERRCRDHVGEQRHAAEVYQSPPPRPGQEHNPARS